MKLNKILAALLCTSAIGATTQAQAGLITFEGMTIGTVVTTQFTASDGVTFTTSPVVGGVGGTTGPVPPANGLDGWVYNPILGQDDPDTFRPGLPTEGAANGLRFITDSTGISGPSTTLKVTYTDPVGALSFDLFDLDGYQTFLPAGSVESYHIEIFKADLTSLGFIDVVAGVALSGVASGVDSFGKLVGDGIVSRFGFNVGANDIKFLEITGSRPAGNFGLAFDNFETNTFTNSVPEPASLALLGTGLMGLVFARRRKTA